MGDLHYEGQEDGQKDLLSAAQMYKTAALRKEPQVYFFIYLFLSLILKQCQTFLSSHVRLTVYSSISGMVQPWPSHWGGFQAAAVDTDRAGYFAALPVGPNSALKCFVQKVCWMVFVPSIWCKSVSFGLRPEPVRYCFFFLQGAETQMTRTPTCLVAWPFLRCISSYSRKNTVLLLRSVPNVLYLH